MAKSQSEAPLRVAFSLGSLRGAEGDEAISKDSPGGTKQCLARARIPIAFRHCEERSDEAISQNGQPEMRQA